MGSTPILSVSSLEVGDSMILVVNDTSYQATHKEAEELLALMSKNFPNGIYAIEKPGYLEFKKEVFDPAEHGTQTVKMLNKAIREYEEYGFMVYANWQGQRCKSARPRNHWKGFRAKRVDRKKFMDCFVEWSKGRMSVQDAADELGLSHPTTLKRFHKTLMNGNRPHDVWFHDG